MMNAKTEEARATHWDVVLPVLSRKFQNELGGEFTCEELVHCLHRRRFKTRFEICKDEDGELSDIRAIRRHSGEILIPSILMNYVMIPYMEVNASTMWISSTRSIIYCRSWIRDRRKRT